MFPSLWHKCWCRFFIAKDYTSVDIRGVLLPVSMWICWLHMYVLFLLYPKSRILVVCCVWSNSWKLVSPPCQCSHGPCCGFLSPVPLILIVVHVEALRVFWWQRHHIFMEGPMVDPGSRSVNCHKIPSYLGPCGYEWREIYLSSAPPDFLVPFLSTCP